MSGSIRSAPWIWLVLGGLLFALSNGNWAIPAASWTALPLLLRFARQKPSIRGLAALFAILTAASLVILWPMLSLAMIPPGMRLAAGLAWGMTALLPFLADRWLAGRCRGLTATLVFPMAWAVTEWLCSLKPDGSWGALAYTQYGSWPFMQLASITGLFGLSFGVAWFASIVNLAWETGFDRGRIRRPLLAYAATMALVLLYGGARLASIRPTANPVGVAAVTNPPGFPTYFDMARREAPLPDNTKERDRLLALTAKAAAAGAKVVVWQEYALFFDQDKEARFLEAATVLARTAGIHLVACYGLKPGESRGEPWVNLLVWLGPDGRVLGRYRKAHPSGALEPDIVPGGKGPLVVETEFGKIGAVICTDQDFPGHIRQAGRAGVGLLLVPSAGWPQVVPLHTHMAAFRAVENGFSLVKATGQGVSAAFDPLGRVLASQGYGEHEANLMLATVPVMRCFTPYGVVGDLFAAACLAGLALAGIRKKGAADGTGRDASEPA